MPSIGSMRAALYLRLSEDKRAGTDEEGWNVGTQEKRGRALAADLGMSVVAVYNDNDKSAKKPRSRPAFAQMLKDAEAGKFDAAICLDLDRLYRHPVDMEDLVSAFSPRNILVHQIRTGHPLDLTSPQGLLIAGIMAQVTRHELQQKEKRQKDANRERALEGQMHRGRIPFGYQKDRKTPDPEEAKIIRDIVRRYLGGESFNSIAKRYQMDRGSMRARILTPTIAGIVVHAGVRYPDVVAQWEPIISRDDFYAVEALMAQESRKSPSVGNRAAYLLSGLVRCADCHVKMSAGTNATYPVWVCKSCGRTIKRDSLCDYVEQRFLDLKVVQQVENEPTDIGPELARLESLITGKYAQMRQSDKAARLRLLEEIDGLEAQAEAVRASDRPVTYREVSAEELWTQAEDIGEKREILREHIRTLEVHRATNRSKFADIGERVTLTFNVVVDPHYWEPDHSMRVIKQGK